MPLFVGASMIYGAVTPWQRGPAVKVYAFHFLT
jgi:hypothetical protein